METRWQGKARKERLITYNTTVVEDINKKFRER
jgi:hypothetical protein